MATLRDLVTGFVKGLKKAPVVQNLGAWLQVAKSPQLRQDYTNLVIKPATLRISQAKPFVYRPPLESAYKQFGRGVTSSVINAPPIKALKMVLPAGEAFLREGARALPLPQPERVANWLIQKPGVERVVRPIAAVWNTPISELQKGRIAPSQEAARRQVTQITKPFEQYTPAEKIAGVVGSGISTYGQFVVAGKIADFLLQPVAKYLQYSKLAPKVTESLTKSGKFLGEGGVNVIDMFKVEKEMAKYGLTVKAFVSPAIKSALQWGIYQVPRLQASTTTGKIRELSDAMFTGGVFGQIAAAKSVPLYQKYLANVFAPLIIKATVGGKPEEAKRNLPYYALAGLTTFAGGKEPKALVPVGQAGAEGFAPPPPPSTPGTQGVPKEEFALKIQEPPKPKPEQIQMGELGKTAPAEIQRMFERLGQEKVTPKGKILEELPIGKEIEKGVLKEQMGGGLFQPTSAPAPKPQGVGGERGAEPKFVEGIAYPINKPIPYRLSTKGVGEVNVVKGAGGKYQFKNTAFDNWGIFKDGKKVGYVEGKESNGKLFINKIEVQPEFRKQGIATQALDNIKLETGAQTVIYEKTTGAGANEFWEKYLSKEPQFQGVGGEGIKETPIVQPSEDAIQLVKAALKSGDIEAATALYDDLKKDYSLPPLEEIKGGIPPEEVLEAKPVSAPTPTQEISNVPSNLVVKPEGITTYKKGAIGDLEKKIDELIGYQPLEGSHWTVKYRNRQQLIDNARQEAPPDVIKALDDLEGALSRMKELYRATQPSTQLEQAGYKIEQDYDKKGRVSKITVTTPKGKAFVTNTEAGLNEYARKELKIPPKVIVSKSIKTIEDLVNRSGSVLQGYGAGGRFGNLPPSTATEGKIEWAEQKPFTSTGGRQIGATYEKEFGIPLKVSKLFRTHLGAFYPVTEDGNLVSAEIKVRSFGGLKTLAHETGHYLDYALGQAFSGAKEASGILTGNKVLRDELIKVTEKFTGLIPEEPPSEKTYRRSSKELIAEYVMAYHRDKEKTTKLAPKFTQIFEKAQGTDPEVKFVVDKLNQWDDAFVPIKEYVESLREVPQIKTELEPLKENVNIIQQLYRQNIGDKVWKFITDSVDKVFEGSEVGTLLSEKRGVPNKIDRILTSRARLIQGQQLRFQEEIFDPLTKLTKEDQVKASELLQKFEPSGDLLVEKARNEQATWATLSWKNGLMNDEAFWNEVGQHMPFAYSTKDFAENQKKFGYVNYKKLRADLTAFKHRLSDEEMGVKTLENQWGTWPNAKERISQVPKPELERIGRETREMMGLIKEAPYPLKKSVDKMIQANYTVQAMNLIANEPGVASEIEIPGWQKLPDSAQLGGLRNKYVTPNLYNLLTDIVTPRSSGIIETSLRNLVGVWKGFMVPWNPAAVSRNVMSNTIVAWYGDVPIYDPRWIAKGYTSVVNQNNKYKEARDYGLFKGAYTQEELKRFVIAAEEGGWKKIVEVAGKIYNKPGDLYQFLENSGKMVIYNYLREKGNSVETAVNETQRLLLDYSKVSKLTEWLRSGPVPFATWQMKMIPVLLETAVRKPEKYLIILALLAAGSAYARKKFGLNEEQEKLLKPSYMQGRGNFTMLLPWKDPTGQLQWWDVSNILPGAAWLQTTGETGIIPQALGPSNPSLNLYNAFVSNYDPYFHREIAESYLSPEEKLKKQTEYVLRGSLPPLVPGGRAWTQMLAGLSGTGDYYGRVRSPSALVVRNVFGIKTEPGGKLEYEKKMGEIKGKMNEIERAIYSTGRNQSLSIEERQKQIEKLRSSLARLQEEGRELQRIYQSIDQTGLPSQEESVLPAVKGTGVQIKPIKVSVKGKIPAGLKPTLKTVKIKKLGKIKVGGGGGKKIPKIKIKSPKLTLTPPKLK